MSRSSIIKKNTFIYLSTLCSHLYAKLKQIFIVRSTRGRITTLIKLFNQQPSTTLTVQTIITTGYTELLTYQGSKSSTLEAGKEISRNAFTLLRHNPLGSGRGRWV